MQKIKANYIDIFNRKTFAAEVCIEEGKIKSISAIDEIAENYILPGFVDAHIHIESSMLVPSEFAKIAVQHGTVGTVSDPHEIANVCGLQGVYYMIENARKVPLKFNFGAPSCVPATSFETAGAIIDSKDIKNLLANDEIKYLSEMMNFPGVLFEDEEVLQKIAHAKQANKPIDGHAPGLIGEDAIRYINAGISTDHECTNYDEALHKLKHGMKILIREGSAAKNFDALIDLLPQYYENMMFCCDDKHPDELLLHHINLHVKKALEKGMDLYSVLQVACINPVLHYKLDIGLLQQNDNADFIIVNNTKDFKILQTFINGECVYDNGIVKFETEKERVINNFNCLAKTIDEIKVEYKGQETIPIINALDGQLITKASFEMPKIEDNYLVSDIDKDLLKIVVVNRYSNQKPAIAFIKNFGLKNGAIASTVAHDCHNIIAVGVNDKFILESINALINCKGGICVCDEKNLDVLSLPVAGIMSNEDANTVAALYSSIDKKAKQLGSTLSAPFMTLSFMALLVIPEIKLSDKGLWNGLDWKFY